MKDNKKILPCIIGLGYVGLPIFVNLSKKFDTCGFDIDKERIKELNKNIDKNLEFKKKDLINNTKSFFTTKIENLKKVNFFIVTVPTPVTQTNKPDLDPIKKSMLTIRKYLKKNDIIMLESTVFPGVTEKICGSILNKNKFKLKLNKDFFLGYSPERINPGDKKHVISKINKIVAFSNEKNKSKVLKVYSKLSKRIVFSSKIKEAETAKVVENIQRDINIAFINEIFIFCKKSNLDFNEVIKLAKTKWNFLNFKPGLVGGHCLPVDPYYFASIAKKYNQNVKVTLAGRSINNSMVGFISKLIINDIKNIKVQKNIKILIAGLTYKPDVPDLRNSLAIDIFKLIKKNNKNTDGFDPIINNKSRIKMKLEKDIKISKYDRIYVLTEHNVFKKKTLIKNKKIVYVFKDL
tara:strand:+ start:281 stop:1498 length:1218 start_codon:yes stop_codon:yes gene_type:complete